MLQATPASAVTHTVVPDGSGPEQDRGGCAGDPERRGAQIAADVGRREQVVDDRANLLDHRALPPGLRRVAPGSGDELLGGDADDHRDRQREQYLDKIAVGVRGRAEDRGRRRVEGREADEHHHELAQAVAVQRCPEHGDERNQSVGGHRLRGHRHAQQPDPGEQHETA
jgi:hypothetical protein